MIAESGIDALSYAVLHPDTNTRYASTGGAMNPNQPTLIRSAIEKMGQGARIVIATDNDDGGRTLAEQIEAIAAETGRADLQDRPGPSGRGGQRLERRPASSRRVATDPSSLRQRPLDQA